LKYTQTRGKYLSLSGTMKVERGDVGKERNKKHRATWDTEEVAHVLARFV
jgi:hypothetical protein